MSLLHDALKKAEKVRGAAANHGGVTVDAEGEAGASHKRTFVLLAAASVLLLAFTYFKFIRKPGAGTAAQQAAAQGSVTQAQQADGLRLLEESASLIQNGRYEEARDTLEKALFATLPPDKTVEAYNNLGFVLKKLGRNEDAFQRYHKALSLDPLCAECRNNLGVLYLSNRDFAEAESHFEGAIKNKPDYAEPYLHLALLMETRGDFTGAKTQYQKYTKLARGVSADFLLKIQERMSALDAK